MVARTSIGCTRCSMRPVLRNSSPSALHWSATATMKRLPVDHPSTCPQRPARRALEHQPHQAGDMEGAHRGPHQLGCATQQPNGPGEHLVAEGLAGAAEGLGRGAIEHQDVVLAVDVEGQQLGKDRHGPPQRDGQQGQQCKGTQGLPASRKMDAVDRRSRGAQSGHGPVSCSPCRGGLGLPKDAALAPVRGASGRAARPLPSVEGLAIARFHVGFEPSTMPISTG